MGTGKINRLKIVLVEQGKTGKWLAEQLGKNEATISRLKIVLVEQGKTGKWLAEQLGKNEATISRWCSNATQPSLDMLMKIASILNVDARRLINNGIEE